MYLERNRILQNATGFCGTQTAHCGALWSIRLCRTVRLLVSRLVILVSPELLPDGLAPGAEGDRAGLVVEDAIGPAPVVDQCARGPVERTRNPQAYNKS